MCSVLVHRFLRWTKVHQALEVSAILFTRKIAGPAQDEVNKQPEEEFLTLTIAGDLSTLTEQDRKTMLDVIAQAAGLKGGIKVVQVSRGSIKLRVVLDRGDAVRLCSAFIDRKLDRAGVENVELAVRPEVVDINQLKEKFGVSRSQAREVVGVVVQRFYG